MKKLPLALATVVALSLSFPIIAQQAAAPAPIKRTVLQRVDVPGTPNYETVTGIAEIAPNVKHRPPHASRCRDRLSDRRGNDVDRRRQGAAITESRRFVSNSDQRDS